MNADETGIVVTIDGPAGAGKTTVSRLLARRLGYRYIDTGAHYRGIAYEAVRQGTDTGRDAELAALCEKMKLAFVRDESGDARLTSDGRDISDRIRTPEITMLASAVSARPVVRDYLLQIQRSMGEAGGAVFEGRDMGTVVFPGAPAKFYLDADQTTRAKRRYLEMSAKTGQTLAEVEQDMQKRDTNDSTRKVAPLKPAEDAVRIDSSAMGIEAVVDMMVKHIQEITC